MSDSLQPYPDYKLSSVDWIGDVPAHWEVQPCRGVFTEIDECGFEDEQLLSVTIAAGVIRQQELLRNTSKRDSSRLDRSSYKLVWPGDLVYNKMRAWQGAAGVSTHKGIVSPAYVVQRPRQSSEPRFFHYLFRTPAFATEAERWSYGIASDMWSLRPEHFKNIRCCLPQLEEQRAIVRYLSYVDRSVRRYVGAKERLIGLLEEEKQAIINQAVTRGLDPSVRLKPSGVEWLGDVPEQWEACRLRNVVSVVTTGSRGWSSYASESGPIFMRVANLSRGSLRLRFDDEVRLSLPKTAEASRARIQPGDLLISVTAYIGSVGVAPDDLKEAYVSQHVARCQPVSGCYPQWLGYVLLSTVGQTHGRLSLYGGTKDGLSLDDVKNYPILLPPLAEQIAIVEYLKGATDESEAKISRARRQIELVEEYRARLIADVVTGKLDVREAAVRLTETDSCNDLEQN